MKILLLEDNENLAEIIKEILEEKHYIVDWFKDGEHALDAILNGYDCFVLDIHVPSLNGIELLKEIRIINENTPIIIISSDIELSTIETAYIKGCNDFLKKPFYIFELEYKISTLCKKNRILNLGNDILYNIEEETLFDADKEAIKLTRKERRFLELLSKSPNNIVSLDAISDYVYEGEYSTLLALRSLVKRLRKKILTDCIRTQNYGYTLIVP